MSCLKQMLHRPSIGRCDSSAARGTAQRHAIAFCSIKTTLNHSCVQADSTAAAVEGAALPADALAMARQLIPQLGRLPELLPPRLLAHAPVRAMQRPLLQLAVRSTWRLREEP